MSFDRSKSSELSFLIITDDRHYAFLWTHLILPSISISEEGEQELTITTSSHSITVVGSKIYDLFQHFRTQDLSWLKRDDPFDPTSTSIRTVTVRAL